jgi:hypothetical protein
MLIDAAHQIVRHPKIERAMLFAREKINVKGHRRPTWLWIPGSTLRIAPE